MCSERMRGNRFTPLHNPIPCRTMKLLDKKGRMNMELTYTPQGDYLLPNLTLSEAETTIGKYGMMRKTFLKTERKGMYAHLMLSEQLNQHLADIDRTAREQIDRTIQELLRLNPAPDKASAPLVWTGHMNNLKQQAEELILTELIYH
ncbi:TnpV protein [Paenibacillus lactis]|uniref:TnpV protein n=1 Tax=Paenibacillus lactis TaxID=228574 RepID=UPI0036CD6F23